MVCRYLLPVFCFHVPVSCFFPQHIAFPEMLLVIDNYDSFTYNLVQYLGELGADPVVRRNDEVEVDEIGELRPRALVLSPGPCTPREAGVTVPVVKRWGAEIPILGVCLGHQAIGQAFGGRDHTTVMHADRKIRQLMAERRSVFNQVTELTNRIKQQARQT